MLPCPQCGNTVVVEEGSTYVRCFNCNQSAYVSGSVLVPFYRMRPAVTLGEASEIMRQWMSAQAGPARLNGVVTLGQPKAYDFLFWSFSGGLGGYDRQIMVPAVSTVLRELRQLQIPSRFVRPDSSSDYDDETSLPTLEREQAQSQAGEGGAENVQTWLIRVPLFEFPYQYDGRNYRVIVDGLSGQCLVDRFPRRPLSTWLGVLVACTAAFAVEGWVLWGTGPLLAAAYSMTAVGAAGATLAVMKKRRESQDRD